MKRRGYVRKIIFGSVFIAMFLSILTLCTAESVSNRIATLPSNRTAIVPTLTPTPVAAPKPGISSKIDQYLKAYESKGWFSGSILVAKQGEILISKGYGMANYELDVPNRPETKFHLGSVTKQFTSMAIMQLYDRGLLDVNDPLSKYIPDYPNGKKITIHHLLTHTSGIPDYINDDSSFNSICRLYHSLDQIIDRFKNKSLEFQPGVRYDYSNSGYVLLSYIVEKVSGKTYEEFLEENIFKPLNMKNTGYDHLTPIVKKRASGYSISSDKLTNAEFFDRSNLQGADGLYSTVEDLYIWDQALYTEKLVSQGTMDKIFTPYPPATTYGYGWTTNKTEMKHFGRMDGFYTFIYRNIKDKTTIIVLSNIQQAPINIISKDLVNILNEKEYKMPDNLRCIRIETSE